MAGYSVLALCFTIVKQIKNEKELVDFLDFHLLIFMRAFCDFEIR